MTSGNTRQVPLTALEITWLSADYTYAQTEILKFRKKWVNLRHHAKTRGISCSLTFIDFLDLAKDAGLTCADDIGKQVSKHQLGRTGDRGGYDLNNCRFITAAQNRIESVINGGQAVGNLNHSGSMNGHAKLTESHVLRIRELHSEGRHTQTALCAMYHVSPATMSTIINRVIWRHI